jgi:hypothetical protein
VCEDSDASVIGRYQQGDDISSETGGNQPLWKQGDVNFSERRGSTTEAKIGKINCYIKNRGTTTVLKMVFNCKQINIILIFLTLKW